MLFLLAIMVGCLDATADEPAQPRVVLVIDADPLGYGCSGQECCPEGFVAVGQNDGFTVCLGS